MSHEMDEDDLLAADDAAEEIMDNDDAAMDSDDEEHEVVLQNDSIAYFDIPQDSLFAIAQHPVDENLVAVGGSAGREDNAPGAGWVVDLSPARPLLPSSYAGQPSPRSLSSVFSLDGHEDSINALAWTLPRGDAVVSGGLDGRLRAWKATGEFLGEAREVDEINWLAACPSPTHPNAIALGAGNGSVWVYAIGDELEILQSYFLHTSSCTAGSWTPDGKFLSTISEDGSMYVWDVFGHRGAIVSHTADDARFEVEGGLYSITTDPKGTFVAVGGAGGAIRIVALPGGQILASLQAQGDSIETLAVTSVSSVPPTTLLAAGSVDGSVCVYDATRRFAVRRMLNGAHEDQSVVKVDFVPGTWLLTSCGMDGVVRRWDLRAGAGASESALQREWKGHMGGGEGGGVLGFVQGKTGQTLVTAGDDGVSLVFTAS